MTEKEINEVDGALWGLSISMDGQYAECETTVYKFDHKNIKLNEDIGSYKYNVFTFKPAEAANTVEFMKAHIGDVRKFIDNYAKAGYNGLMVKEGCVPKKAIKEMIRVTCRSFDIPEKSLRPILAQV